MSLLRQDIKGLVRDRTGGSALEFALVALPFMLLLLGLIEGGRVLFYHNALSGATQAASRQLAIDNDATAAGLKQYVSTQVQSFDADRLTLTFVDTSSGGFSYRRIVTTYDFDLMLPILFDFEIVLQNESVIPLL
ncbi:TadE/TadG family type IV pilus assembly protein [uncultured Roseobacter sp.]|uniref:TadE/TadG family type IV pilus assembly protein n=1 Tax=uncultured Roseobacter sp. TaxID=114847 RepID=UPI00263331E1|nr:TadE/TadG family type IV pilus assembly protein [uncultured Roseobacter sp.]